MFLSFFGLVRKSVAEADREDAVAAAVRQQMEFKFDDYKARTPNKGVLLAVQNLPTAVIDALRKVFTDLGDLSTGEVTTDEQAMVYKLDGGIATLTLWPFPGQQSVSIASTRDPNLYCTVSYQEGFNDAALDRLAGFYGRLSASAGQTIISFAEMLTQSVTAQHEPTEAATSQTDD
jgi:hypothetical protein